MERLVDVLRQRYPEVSAMMFRRRAQDAQDTDTGALRCSFCRKSKDSVQQLISSPSDYPRAYICDECVAVCASILEDDRIEDDHDPLTPQLLAAVEDWIRKEWSGADACEELAEVRAIAFRLVLPGACHPPK
jgi:hypothetical protein